MYYAKVYNYRACRFLLMLSWTDSSHFLRSTEIHNSPALLLVAPLRMQFWLCVCYQREFSKPLHVAYVDIKAAFDSVDRDALWKALKAKRAPPFLIKAHQGPSSGNEVVGRVRIGRQLTNTFLTSSGVRQGCILAPMLSA